MDFILREWRPDDAASLVTYGGSASVAAGMRDGFPHPFTEDAAEKFIASALSSDPAKTMLRAIDAGGMAIGSIGVFQQDDIYRKSATIAYWLAEPYWGKGIMTAAVMRMCGAAFDRFDIVRISAEPFAHNTGSRRVLEKAGFILEGVHKKSVFKNGSLGDSCTYALLK